MSENRCCLVWRKIVQSAMRPDRYRTYGISALATILVVILGISLWGQQTQREYIYLGGKTIATDTQAITPPSLAITSPTSASSYWASTDPITIAGTASDNVGVAQVSWRSDQGGGGICTGTSSWTCSGIPVQSNANLITVIARDNEGSSITDSLLINKCIYSLSPTYVEIDYSGGALPIGITTNSACPWTAGSNAPWITISGSSSGSGNGVVNFVAAATSPPPRSGTVTVAAQAIPIYQFDACPTQCELTHQSCMSSIAGTCPVTCTEMLMQIPQCQMDPGSCAGLYQSCLGGCAEQMAQSCSSQRDQCLASCN